MVMPLQPFQSPPDTCEWLANGFFAPANHCMLQFFSSCNNPCSLAPLRTLFWGVIACITSPLFFSLGMVFSYCSSTKGRRSPKSITTEPVAIPEQQPVRPLNPIESKESSWDRLVHHGLETKCFGPVFEAFEKVSDEEKPEAARQIEQAIEKRQDTLTKLESVDLAFLFVQECFHMGYRDHWDARFKVFLWSHSKNNPALHADLQNSAPFSSLAGITCANGECHVYASLTNSDHRGWVIAKDTVRNMTRTERLAYLKRALLETATYSEVSEYGRTHRRTLSECISKECDCIDSSTSIEKFLSIEVLSFDYSVKEMVARIALLRNTQQFAIPAIFHSCTKKFSKFYKAIVKNQFNKRASECIPEDCDFQELQKSASLGSRAYQFCLDLIVHAYPEKEARVASFERRDSEQPENRKCSQDFLTSRTLKIIQKEQAVFTDFVKENIKNIVRLLGEKDFHRNRNNHPVEP